MFVCREFNTKTKRIRRRGSLAVIASCRGEGTVLFGCGSCPDVELAIVRDKKRVVRGVGEIWVRSPSRAPWLLALCRKFCGDLRGLVGR